MLDNVYKPVVIALGYFDSVHKGHQKVIKTAVKIATDLGVTPVVFTFDGNLRKAFGGSNAKYVFNTSERSSLINGLGVKEIFFAPVSDEFLGMDRAAFLDYLNSLYNIKGYVSGSDYSFGKGGTGDIEYLNAYAKNKGQFLTVVDAVSLDDKVISTTRIKELMSNGDIKKVTTLLGFNYFVTGEVYADRQKGKELGFPTANIKLDVERANLKNGVYSGVVKVDDKEYKALINYGNRPTFDLDEVIVEAHLLDFNDNLYGKEIKIEFKSFIRDIIKFNTPDELRDRIKLDLAKIKGDDV
ncbi:MAG: riboflavin biosynthesis protein RibF [Clostridiales bacterium]|nr:riboflavin biosynthesis protein RibF [Clostridiales bacterium]